MSKLFEETTINGLKLKNRSVCSATWNGMANADGSCSQKMIDSVTKPAKGGVGMTIGGAAFVSRAGHLFPGQGGIYSDDLLPGLTSMSRAVHQAGGSIISQLRHGGIAANPGLTGQDPWCRQC